MTLLRRHLLVLLLSKKKVLLIFCTLSFLGLNDLLSQQITIIEDPLVQEVVEKFAQSNRSKTYMEGWRIQILSSTDRSKIEATKSEFRSYFPGLWVDWLHIKPSYKLQAGAYSSYLNCLPDLERIKKVYPGAYATKVKNIDPKEILGWN